MDTPTLPKTYTATYYAHLSRWEDGVIDLWAHDMSNQGYALIGPVEITFDVPQVDVVAAQINSLEKVKADLVEEYETKLHKISEQIQNLRALSYQPE